MIRNIYELFGKTSLTTLRWTSKAWSKGHRAGENTKATISKALVSGQIHVCTGLTVTLCSDGTAPTAALVTVALIDGATGGTTYLWGPHDLSVPAVAGVPNGISRTALFIPGTTGTAMTIEFSAAAGAHTYEAVSMEGISIPG